MSIFVANVCLFTSFWTDVFLHPASKLLKDWTCHLHMIKMTYISVLAFFAKKTLSSSDWGKRWLKGIWIVVFSVTTGCIILSDGRDCCDPLLITVNARWIEKKTPHNILWSLAGIMYVPDWGQMQLAPSQRGWLNKEIGFRVICTVPTVIIINQIQLTQLELIVYHVSTFLI